MAFELNPGAILAILSGVSLVALGLLLLRVRPVTRPIAAFSAFAVLWGLQATAANVYDLAADPSTGRPWAYAFVQLVIPLHLPLLYFASVFPWRSNRLGRSPAVLVAATIPAFALLVLFPFRPDLFIEEVYLVAPGVLDQVTGPLFWPVTLGNAIAAFPAALLITARKLFRARGDLLARQVALVTAALVAYVSYRTADVAFLAFAGGSLAAAQGLFVFGLYAACVAFAAVALVYVMGHVVVRKDLPARRLLLAAGTVPFLVGCVEWFLLLGVDLGGLQTAGLWRLVMVALFAYAIVRYRLFGIDLKVRWTVKQSTAAGVLAGGFVVISEGLESVLDLDGTAAAVAAAAGIALALHPVRRGAERLVSAIMPGVADTPEYRDRHRRDIVRAAFEDALADGEVTERERRILDRIAREFDIDRQAVASIEADVRRSLGRTAVAG